MANYPCPVCGASHKSPPYKCRLCGQLMGEDADLGDFTGSRQVAAKRKGVGGIAIAVAIGVIVIAVAAVIIGLLPGRESLSSVANRVPVLSDERTKAGWVVLDASDEGFTVEMPSETPEQATVTRTYLGTPHQVQVWTAWIGEDTLVEVAVARDVLPDGVREFDTVAEIADEIEATYGDSRTATVETKKEITYQGHPAKRVEVRNVRLEEQLGVDFFRKTIVFFDDGDLWEITAFTKDPTSPSFDTLSGSFSLTERTPVDG